MNWLQHLPGFQRSPCGLEWSLWKRMPAIFLWGSVLPGAVAVCLHFSAGEAPTSAEARSLLLADYVLAGVVLLHWTLVLTVGIGCVIVMIMKGQAYVADAYELNDSDQPS